MDVKILENSVASDDRSGNLSNRHHQVVQNRIVVFSIIKKVELRSTIDRGNLRQKIWLYIAKS